MQTAMAPVAFAAMCGQTAAVRHFLKLNDLDVSLHAVSVYDFVYTCIYLYCEHCHI